MIKPLEGLCVLEFCQYLSGPSAGLRLADLGARVIKMERPDGGDAGRKLAIKNMWVGEDSLLFHTINRNKESVTVDLNNAEDSIFIQQLIEKADVLIHNFRPGIMEKKGLGFDEVRAMNPRLVYAVVSGYGNEGPWVKKPGQDLLIQSMTGLAFTTGTSLQSPVPFGIAVGDILCGAQLVQGILAALIRRQKTNIGGLVEISLVESLVDFQFELLTTYFASGVVPERSQVMSGHSLLGAPYGVYATTDGYIALAMMDIPSLSNALNIPSLLQYDAEQYFTKRDEIKKAIAQVIATQSSASCLEKLLEAGLWAMEVLDWKKLRKEEAYQLIQMEQSIHHHSGTITTTRCPIKIDGQIMTSQRPAPALGADLQKLKEEVQYK